MAAMVLAIMAAMGVAEALLAGIIKTEILEACQLVELEADMRGLAELVV